MEETSKQVNIMGRNTYKGALSRIIELKNVGYSVAEIALMEKISPSTVYKLLREKAYSRIVYYEKQNP